MREAGELGVGSDCLIREAAALGQCRCFGSGSLALARIQPNKSISVHASSMVACDAAPLL